MATHLDLEEQEQLDQLKAFWNTYGTLITWVVLIAAAAVLSWNGWQYYQRRQAAQAAALYDELDRAVQSGEADRVQRGLRERGRDLRQLLAGGGDGTALAHEPEEGARVASRQTARHDAAPARPTKSVTKRS